MKLKELRSFGKEFLRNADIYDYATDADLLLSHVCGFGGAQFILKGDEEISEFETKRYKSLLEKRRGHVPVQQLTGRAFFYGNEFIVNKNCLIPRFDTEILVEEAIEHFSPGDSVLDMFTGSGCIIVSLAKHFLGEGHFCGSDISMDALLVAEENAKKHRVKVDFYCGDMTLPIPKTSRFDIITANPPYIRKRDIEELSNEVKDFEPRRALDGGEDGLLYYRRLASSAGDFLKPGGRLIMEIGYDQGKAVEEIFSGNKFKNIYIKKDFAGLDRIVGMEYV